MVLAFTMNVGLEVHVVGAIVPSHFIVYVDGEAVNYFNLAKTVPDEIVDVNVAKSVDKTDPFKK